MEDLTHDLDSGLNLDSESVASSQAHYELYVDGIASDNDEKFNEFDTSEVSIYPENVASLCVSWRRYYWQRYTLQITSGVLFDLTETCCDLCQSLQSEIKIRFQLGDNDIEVWVDDESITLNSHLEGTKRIRLYSLNGEWICNP
jgi:hypothetical protein